MKLTRLVLDVGNAEEASDSDIDLSPAVSHKGGDTQRSDNRSQWLMNLALKGSQQNLLKPPPKQNSFRNLLSKPQLSQRNLLAAPQGLNKRCSTQRDFKRAKDALKIEENNTKF